MTEKTVLTENLEETAVLFGTYDLNTSLIERAFSVAISARDTAEAGGSAILIRGEEPELVEKAAETVRYCLRMIRLNAALEALQ